METELEGNSMKNEIIQGLEVENLLISSKEVDKISKPQITLFAVACGWHGKRDTMIIGQLTINVLKKGYQVISV